MFSQIFCQRFCQRFCQFCATFCQRNILNYEVLLHKLVSSAFALLFTEISVVRGIEISVKSR